MVSICASCVIENGMERRRKEVWLKRPKIDPLISQTSTPTHSPRVCLNLYEKFKKSPIKKWWLVLLFIISFAFDDFLWFGWNPTWNYIHQSGFTFYKQKQHCLTNWITLLLFDSWKQKQHRLTNWITLILFLT